MGNEDLSGRWNSEYYYHDQDVGRHALEAVVRFGWFAANSVPQADGSFVRLDLLIGDDNTLTGVWSETTSPSGLYAGQRFHGALQLLLSEDRNTAEGLWLGHDSDYSEINSGRWILTREVE